jgi:hypothetical protein
MASGQTRRLALTAAILALAAPAGAQRAPTIGPTNLSPDILAMACAPAIADEAPPTPLRITGGQDSFARLVYSTSDLVTLNAGTKNGIEVGQEYFVRRVQVERGAPSHSPVSIRTAGWITVYAVDDELSLATVSHACDTINVGDFLEPLVHRLMPAPNGDRGKPKRDDYGRVMPGNDFRRSFANGDFFILDRGSDFGIVPGSELVVYRDKKQAENFLYEIGEAVAVRVYPTWSTLRLTIARDAVQEGDYVGMRTKNPN